MYVRSVRAYLLMTYDFLAWVLSFVAMATLQYVVGYSGSEDIAPAALFGVSCGLGFILLGSTVNLHQGRAAVGSFPDAVLTSIVGGLVASVALVANFSLGSPARVSVMVTGPMAACSRARARASAASSASDGGCP